MIRKILNNKYFLFFGVFFLTFNSCYLCFLFVENVIKKEVNKQLEKIMIDKPNIYQKIIEETYFKRKNENSK